MLFKIYSSASPQLGHIITPSEGLFIPQSSTAQFLHL